MKTKKVITLLTAIAVSSLFLNGCSTDLTSINADETTVSAEMETENLSDGNVRMHSVWYNADGSALSGATVTFTADKEDIFTGTTDENGNLEVCSLTGNTAITCTITDNSGETIAESEIILKISSDYTALTIYPVHSSDKSERVVEIPTDKTEIRAAVFVTEDQEISFANISPYSESAADDTAQDADTTDTADTDTSADAAAQPADTTDTQQ